MCVQKCAEDQYQPTSTDSSTRKWVFICKSFKEREAWARAFQFAIDKLRAQKYNLVDNDVPLGEVNTTDQGEGEEEEEEEEEEKEVHEKPQPEYITLKESILLMKLDTGNSDDGEEFEACNFTALQKTVDGKINIQYSKISKAILEPKTNSGSNIAVGSNMYHGSNDARDERHITPRDYKVCVDYEEPLLASSSTSSSSSYPKRRKYGLLLLARGVRNIFKQQQQYSDSSNGKSSPPSSSLLGMIMRLENEEEKSHWMELFNTVLDATENDMKMAKLQVKEENAKLLSEMEKRQRFEASMQPISGNCLFYFL